MGKEEHFIQCACVQMLRYSQMLVFSVPNGIFFNSETKRKGIAYMNKLKREGLLNGASDLILVLPNKTIYVEIKTLKGKQSADQKTFQEKIESLGHEYLLWRSLEDCYHWIKEYKNAK